MNDLGKCDHCNRNFTYSLVHSGFNDSAFAYCDTCGCTALLSVYSKIARSISLDFQSIDARVEPYLKQCSCGGHFRANASPRCPNCNHTISADKATGYIEANAPGTLKGWRWERSWHGLYAIIIENRVTHDQWLENSS